MRKGKGKGNENFTKLRKGKRKGKENFTKLRKGKGKGKEKFLKMRKGKGKKYVFPKILPKKVKKKENHSKISCVQRWAFGRKLAHLA